MRVKTGKNLGFYNKSSEASTGRTTLRYLTKQWGGVYDHRSIQGPSTDLSTNSSDPHPKTVCKT